MCDPVLAAPFDFAPTENTCAKLKALLHHAIRGRCTFCARNSLLIGSVHHAGE